MSSRLWWGTLPRLGQRLPRPQPGRTSCVFMQEQVGPSWGRPGVLPQPGPTGVPGPLFSLQDDPDDHPHARFPSSCSPTVPSSGPTFGRKATCPLLLFFTNAHTHSHACRISILNQLYRPSLISFQGRALEPSAGLVCALKITVSEVMNGTAFALLFLPERGGLNRVGE